jgi:hypothetical protein
VIWDFKDKFSEPKFSELLGVPSRKLTAHFPPFNEFTGTLEDD